jgi:hypothetical protein
VNGKGACGRPYMLANQHANSCIKLALGCLLAAEENSLFGGSLLSSLAELSISSLAD